MIKEYVSRTFYPVYLEKLDFYIIKAKRILESDTVIKCYIAYTRIFYLLMVHLLLNIFSYKIQVYIFVKIPIYSYLSMTFHLERSFAPRCTKFAVFSKIWT